MNLKDLVAVSGVAGIYELAINRKDGLVLRNFDTGKKKFYASRRHQFTPLESISIYTMTDTVELKGVFKMMLEQFEDNPPVTSKAKPEEVREYFRDILPGHDEDKVYIGDIKKIIKWFNFLKDKDLLNRPEEVEEVEETKEEA